MKKQLLTLALGVLSTMSFAQTDFVQANDNTGFTYHCENKADAGLDNVELTPGDASSLSGWTFWGPGCSGGDAGGGGVDESLTNVLDFGWGLGAPGKLYIILTLTNPLDLSATANQNLSVDLQSLDAPGGSALPLTYELSFEAANGDAVLDLTKTNLSVTGTKQTFLVDLSSKIATGKNLSSVKKIIFIYDGCPSSPVGSAHLFVSNFKVGSALVATGVNAAQNISESKVFPNPSSGLVNVQLDLKSNSNVKVVLNDLFGREVKVIAEGNYSTLNETFNVSDLAKGMYTVTYILNNAPAKTEILMVK